MPALRRRRPLLVALAILLAGLAAGTALGLGDRILDLFSGKPAPHGVKKQFGRLFEDEPSIIPAFGFAPGVIISKLHGVLAIRTSAEPIVLWAAPTRSGTVCFHFQFVDPKTGRGFSGGIIGGCGPFVFPRGAPALANIDSGTSPSGARVPFVWGVAKKGVARVELRLSGNVVKRTRVFEQFFAVPLPSAAILDEVVALNARGAEIGRWRPDTSPRKQRPQPVLTGDYRRVARIESHGRTFTLSAAPATGGGHCLALTSERNGGRSGSEGCPPLSRGPIGNVLPGEHRVPKPAVAYFYGWVGENVAQLQLRYEDGASDDIPITKTFVLYVVPRAHEQRGHRPAELVAGNASGRIIARRSLLRTP